jgi:CheY-like chemotaxis protein
MRVLIIESDAAFAREASAALRERGVEAQVVDDGQVGMENARSDRPDAVVLSVELGDRLQAGYSICNRIKKDDELKDIPLLLISSHATEETFEQHRKLKTRADHYLRKPFSIDAFLSALEEMVPGLFEDQVAPAAAGRTERFAWTGLDLDEPGVPLDGPVSRVTELEDEPLFGGVRNGSDEDLDLDDLFVPKAPKPADEAPKRFVPEVAPPPAPLAAAAAVAAHAAPEVASPRRDDEESRRLQRELEATKAERDESRRALDAAVTERDEARRALETAVAERDEARARLSAVEEKLREAVAAREAAERKVEELRRLAQNAGALQERLEETREALSAKEAETHRLRRRLEQVEQVRQRAQKALSVASELLQSVRLEPER